MFVLLLSPYKVGSCYLAKILEANGVPFVRLHAYDNVERNKYPPEIITHFITAERKVHLNLYISAYYADIHQAPHYPYAFASSEDAVNAAPTRDLVNHFFRQPWHTYRWLNYNYYRGWQRWFAARSVPTLTLHTESLSVDVEQLLPTFFKDHKKKWTFDPTPSHVTKDNPSGARYLELRKAITNEHERRMYWAYKRTSVASLLK